LLHHLIACVVMTDDMRNVVPPAMAPFADD